MQVEATDETSALPVKTEVEDDLGDWSQDAQPPEPYPMSLDADSFPETQLDGVPPDEGEDEGSSRNGHRSESAGNTSLNPINPKPYKPYIAHCL